MTKEEAKLKLREAQDNLRQAEVILEMHENGMREIKEDIRELKAIINKKDDWKSVEVPDEWHQLYLEKITLMADMMRFAYIKNEGWVPDWEDSYNKKWGLSINNIEGVNLDSYFNYNHFIFGIVVKSQEIAQEML
ncbi:MAG: hypothetical protein PHN55_15120, partial [Dysgonamonadaceae bacterium]|nr:hypothetical protein [Dysgonamonadaceae bacterium]